MRKSMPSSRDNPGAFRVVPRPTLRSVVRKALVLARRGEMRAAALSVAADGANLLSSRVARQRRFLCPCCGQEVSSFRHVAGSSHVAWNSACPACDSRSRHRGLALLLPQLLTRYHPSSVIHFAPEPILRRYFEGPGLRYETADLHLEDATHRGVDVQQLPFSDGSYDMIVCNHVLEHVPDDRKALCELHRIMSERGLAVLTVPGDFTRQPTIRFVGELPNGHYRDYGLELVALLEEVFASVEVVDMHSLDVAGFGRSHGIRRNDMAFICRRQVRPRA